MAQHRHKRETPAPPAPSRIPRSVLVSAPLAVVATLSAVTMGVLAAEPASNDNLLASSGTSQPAAGATVDDTALRRRSETTTVSRSQIRTAAKAEAAASEKAAAAAAKPPKAAKAAVAKKPVVKKADAAKRSAHAESRLAQILIAPIVSEKATMAAEKHNQVLFKVMRDATKPEIKAAVEFMFKTQVKSVSIANVRGKQKRFGRFMGKRASWKKAYVALQAGQEINFAEGEAK